MIIGNVLWPFYGAFFAQLIPLFLLVEAIILRIFFKRIRFIKTLGIVMLANIASTILGLILTNPLMCFWDSMAVKASEQFNACIVAFLLTVPLEAFVICAFSRSRVIRASFWMNLVTYAICFSYVCYAWNYGKYLDRC